jgi:hypothetical protein
MILEYKNNIVSISEQGLNLPEFRKIYDKDTTEKKEEFRKFIDYMWFVYSRDSIYADILPSYRKQLACTDRLKGNGSCWKKLEGDKDNMEAIEKFVSLMTRPKERLYLESVSKKEEYIKFWKDTKIDSKNHDLVADTLKNTKDLMTVLNILEKQAMEEKDTKSVGGGKSSMFED